MKSYTITVNGNVYDVTVEENRRSERTGSSTETCSSTGGRTGSGSRHRQQAQAALRSRQAQQERYSSLRSLSVMPLRRETASWFLRS